MPLAALQPASYSFKVSAHLLFCLILAMTLGGRWWNRGIERAHFTYKETGPEEVSDFLRMKAVQLKPGPQAWSSCWG